MRTKSFWHSNLLPLSEIQVLSSFFQKAISKLQAKNLIWLLAFSSLILTPSCNKDEPAFSPYELSQEEINFFKPGYIESTNTNVKHLQLISQRSLSVVDSVYNEVKRQNQEYHFVSYLIEEYGYPIWSYADYIPVDSDSNINIVVIPMAFSNGTELSGLLLAAYNGSSFDFEIFSRHHLEGLISQFCDVATDQEILGILAIQTMEERIFGFSDLITYNQFVSCPRFEAQSNQPTIVPRDGEIEEVCFTYCTRWTIDGVVTPNLWASFCSFSHDFWYACPNPNPMDETNEHKIRRCTNWLEVCIQYIVGIDPVAIFHQKKFLIRHLLRKQVRPFKLVIY